MTLTLDSTTEQRIQREIELGHYREPAEVVAHAVALLDTDYESKREGGGGAKNDSTESAVDRAFGLWADRSEDGLAYQERMRSEW